MQTTLIESRKRNQTLTRFTLTFGLISALELVSNFLQGSFPVFHYIAKPLVLVSLFAYFFWQTRTYRGTFYLVMKTGLLFSLLGDIFLMFEGAQFFILGLSAFLLAHVCYIVVFSRTDNPLKAKPLLLRKPWLISLFLIYGGLIMWLILDGLNDMLWPVVIYMGVILTMAVMALNRWKRVSQISFAYVFLGALLFVLSDSIIAIDRFASSQIPIPMASTWIMLTYMAAQYLIVVGVLHHIWRPKPQVVGMN